MPATVGIVTDFLATAGTATLEGAAADATIGAAVGAGVSGITGGNVGKGALEGGIGGLGVGAGPLLGGALGLDAGGLAAGALDVGTGALGGLAGAAATGGNLGLGAAIGGISGGIEGLSTPSAPSLGGGGGTSLGDASGPSLNAPSATGAAAGGGQAAAAGFSGSGAPVDVGAGGLSAPSSIPEINITGATPVDPITGLSGPSVAGGGAAAQSQPSGAVTPVASLTAPPAAPAAPAAPALGGQPNLSLPAGLSPIGSELPTSGPGAYTLGSTGIEPATTPASSNNFTSGLGKSLTSPSALLAAGGLALEAATQPKIPSVSSTTGALSTQAGNLASQGSLLESYINTGQLPAGLQTAITNSVNAQKASIRSQAATMGLTGSTYETTALDQVDQQAAGQVAQIATSLLQTGINESQISSGIYNNLLSEANTQQSIMMSSISNFAAALAGSTKGITLNLAGAQAA